MSYISRSADVLVWKWLLLAQTLYNCTSDVSAALITLTIVGIENRDVRRHPCEKRLPRPTQCGVRDLRYAKGTAAHFACCACKDMTCACFGAVTSQKHRET